MTSLQKIKELHDNLVQVNSYDQGRHYVNQLSPDDKWPSVTTVLSKFQDKSFLYKWRVKLGYAEFNDRVEHDLIPEVELNKLSDNAELFESYVLDLGTTIGKKITEDAAELGTKIHFANEVYFTGEDLTLSESEQAIADLFVPLLSSSDLIAIENRTMWSGYLDATGNKVQPNEGIKTGYAGTFDALLSVDLSCFVNEYTNQPIYNEKEKCAVIVDYKIKSKRPSAKFMAGYYLQTSAYSAGVNLCSPELRVNRAIIAVGVHLKTKNDLMLFYLEPYQILWYWSVWRKILACFFYGKPFDWSGFENAVQNSNPILVNGVYKSALPVLIKYKK